MNSNKILDFTLNPNFNHINQDPSEINNTAYETLYDENRLIFLEQSSIFDMPIYLFYSRRIGKDPIQHKKNSNYMSSLL